MPTIPLYDSSAPPDGYHRVTAPGGYEWWSITTQGSRVTIHFSEGNPFDSTYRLAYRRYVADPTRVTPPMPRDHLSVSVNLVDGGQLQVFGPPVTKGSVHYEERPPTVTIGGSSIRWKSDRFVVITLALTNAHRRETLEGQLTLEFAEPVSEEAGEMRGRGRLTGLLREASSNAVHPIDDEARYSHTFSVSPMWQR
jgi:hypothetical protein